MATTIRVPNPGRAEQDAYALWQEQQRSSVNPSIWAGEDPRSVSYCTASRAHVLDQLRRREMDEVRAQSVQVEPVPWEQRVVTMEGSIAYALNLISREAQVMMQPWPGTRARVVLPNGWEVSVNYGPTAYASVRPDFMDSFATMSRLYGRPKGPGWSDEATSAEVAIFQPDGNFYEPHGDGDGQRTWGWVEANEILRVVDAVAKVPGDQLARGKGSPLDGISAECPCPNCVLTDRLVGHSTAVAR